MNYSEDFREMIENYNRQLFEMRKKAKNEETLPVQSNKITTQTPMQPTQKFPFNNNYNLPTISENEVIKGQTIGLDGTGHLTVRVNVANAAAPVQNANVLISFVDGDNEMLIKSLVTNRNGETPKIALNTVKIDESLTSGVKNPYAAYVIRVAKDGYFTIESDNVPIFDKTEAVQTISMIPLPDDYEGTRVLKSNDTGSISLN